MWLIVASWRLLLLLISVISKRDGVNKEKHVPGEIPEQVDKLEASRQTVII